MGKLFLSPTVATLVLALLNPVAAFQLAQPVKFVTASSTSLDAFSRREALAAVSATTALVVGGGVPLVAQADNAGIVIQTADPAAAAKKKAVLDTKQYAFNGLFKDPKHPKGFRVIALALNKQGSMVLEDEPDGQVFNLPIKARTDEKGVIKLDIDFSEKGGPSCVVATFNKRENSIKFPDGNIWTKDTTGPVGVYIDGFAPYPKYRRIIRETDNKNDLSVCMISGKTTFVVSGKVEASNRIRVDFPGDKSCPGVFNSKKGTIVFPDGNTWTRV